MVIAISAVERIAIGANRCNLDAPAQQRALAGVEIPVDAVLLARAGGGWKKHVRRLRAEHLLPRMTECLLGRLVELRNDSFVIDRDDRVERGLEDRAFSSLRLGHRGTEARPIIGLAM